MPSFNGSSHLQFIGFGDQETMFSEILIIIKPYEQNGLFLYNGERMDKTGDFISLNLVDGFVEFRFDLGSGAAILRYFYSLFFSLHNDMMNELSK